MESERPIYRRTARTVRKRKSTVYKPSKSALIVKKVFIVAVFLLAQLLFYYSDFFKLKEIYVYGNSRVSDDVILKTANFPADKNIVTLPLSTFREKLNSIHWIKNSKVKWAVPGRVEVYVEERTPVMQVRQNGKPSCWFAADDEGMVLYKASPGEGARYPHLVIDDSVTIGKKIPKEPIHTIKSLDPLVPRDLKKSFSYYIVNRQEEVIIVVKRNGNEFKVKVGQVEDMARKMNVFRAIMKLIDENNIELEYIDLRPRQPVIKPMDSAAGTGSGDESGGMH